MNSIYLSHNKGCSFHSKPKECAICFDPIRNPIKLPCNHEFCVVCLESWRNKYDIFNTRTCPQCRCTIPPSREMVAEIDSIKSAFMRIEKQLLSDEPVIIPHHPTFAFIRLFPKKDRQKVMRLKLQRQAQIQLESIDQFEERYGRNPEVLDDSACFDELPENVVAAVFENDILTILNFLGPPPITKRRLHAKCRGYSDDTLLHIASSWGNVEIMELMLRLGQMSTTQTSTSLLRFSMPLQKIGRMIELPSFCFAGVLAKPFCLPQASILQSIWLTSPDWKIGII